MASLCCAFASAQTVTHHVTKAKDLENELKQKYGIDMKKMGNPTNRTIYDAGGAVVDSVTAYKRIRAFTHGISYVLPAGATESKRVLHKIDSNSQKRSYEYVMSRPELRPKSPKLQVGEVLDLSALSRRVDAEKLKGKALLLLFWQIEANGSISDQYTQINYAIENHIGSGKLEVLAITHEPFDVASTAMKKYPISNARFYPDAPGITAFYQTDNMQMTVLTDTEHKIILALPQRVGVVPWMLNRLMKQTLY